MSNGTESGGKSIHWPAAYSAKACFMVAGVITIAIIKGRQAGPMSSVLPQMSMGQLYSNTTRFEVIETSMANAKKFSSVGLNQCDQIWRNFDKLAIF